MKSAQYFFSPFRREVALDIGDNKYQNPEQHHDLNGIVNKELNTASDSAFSVQTEELQNTSYKPVKPSHT